MFSGGGSIYSNAMDDWLDGEGRSLSDYGDFGECASTTYGFAENKPCIFIKINKVVDWVPHGIQFSDIDEFWKGVSQILILFYRQIPKYRTFGTFR